MADGTSVILARDVWLLAGHQIEAQDSATIKLGTRVHFAEGARMFAMKNDLTIIEVACWFNHHLSIEAYADIIVIENSIVGPYYYFSDHNHRTGRGRLIREQGYDAEPIEVGSGAW